MIKRKQKKKKLKQKILINKTNLALLILKSFIK